MDNKTLYPIIPSLCPMDQMMEVPASLCGDFLATQGATSILVHPESQQSFLIFEGFHYVEIESGFKVEFPLGVGTSPNLDLLFQ